MTNQPEVHEFHFTEALRNVAKSRPADVSAIGVSILIDHVEELEQELECVRRERKELRYKTSEQSRFIWWVWDVYAKNVHDLISAINLACTYKSAEAAQNGYYGLPMNCWQTIGYLKEYTDKIYDGTYLRNDTGTGVKRELTDAEIEHLGACEAENE